MPTKPKQDDARLDEYPFDTKPSDASENGGEPKQDDARDSTVGADPVGWISDYDILGLVELGADRATIARSQSPCFNTPLYEAASALAAAHSQHEADVARIGELTEAARGMLPENCGLADDPSGGHRPSFEKCERLRSALAKVKP